MRRFHGSFSGYEPNHFFLNRGPEHPFIEMGSALGIAQTTDGRATAPIDLDGDGAMDLAVQSLQDLKVFRNRIRTDHRYLQLTLQTRSGGPAVGAEVRVETDVGRVMDRVRVAAGFHTQLSPRLHLGLGQAQTIKSVVVTWPSGTRTTFSGLPLDRHVVLTEGKSAIRVVKRPKWSASALPPEPARVAWSKPIPDRKGRSVPVVKPGRVTIVNLWAPWCTACRQEAPVLQALHAENEGRVVVAGLIVKPQDQTSVQTFISEYGLTFPQWLLPETWMDALFGGRTEIRLPTTFVFDAQGQLVRRFGRAVGRAELQAIIDGLTVETTIADHLRQAEIETGLEDHAEAFEQLKRALKKAPNRPDILDRMATAARFNGDSEARIHARKRLTEVEPGSPNHWVNYGELIRTYRGSAAAYDAVAGGPDMPPVILFRAAIKAELGQNAEAIKLLEAGLKAHSKDPELKRRLERYRRTKAP